ncbi:MAG: substrate-binding domain-containing protein, partial [Puniceicoccales bacterium]|nr:substrate-binding domain-containing protein [Puniceicoccales bacterium]
KAKPTADTQQVAIISPWDPVHIPPSTLLEIDTLKSLLFTRGISLQLLTPPVFHLQNPGKILSRCIAENNAALWVLYRSTQGMQMWFQSKKIRCLLRGHPQPGINLNKLDTDWEATAYHAGLQLRRIGHTHIGFVAPKEVLQGINAAKAGLTKAIAQEGKISWISEPGTREGFCRILKTVFKAPSPPTALLVTQPREAATALTWLAANKIAVPEQVSLISLADDPNLDVLVPIITRYTIPTQALARLLCRHILRLLNEQPVRRETPLFMPEFIPGETMAPARTTTSI